MGTRRPAERDRAHEYIDSPPLTQRLLYRKHLSARIEGHYGVYRTSVHVARKIAATCSCPSDYWPCKHVRALRATWEANPDSFFDLERYLKTLASRTKAELVDAIGDILFAFPEGLGALGVPEFEPVPDDEYDE